MNVHTERLQFSLLTAIGLMFFAAVIMHGVIHDPNLVAYMVISAALTMGTFKLAVALNKIEFNVMLVWFGYTQFQYFIFFLSGLFAWLTLFYFTAIVSQIFYRP